MPGEERGPSDPRRRRRREERRLLWIVAAFLVVGGSIAIALAYGLPSAALGAWCLLGGAVVLGSLWLILSLIERWTK